MRCDAPWPRAGRSAGARGSRSTVSRNYDHEIRITASVGTALYPRDGIGYAQLMKHADLAKYVAKAASCPAAIEGLLELAQAQDGGAPPRRMEGRKDVTSSRRSDETVMLESL